MYLSSFSKKSISLVFLFVLVFSLFSCTSFPVDFSGSTDEPKTDGANEAPSQEEEVPLEEKALSAEEIYKKASVSVVEITAESKTAVSTGSGFFYDDKGTVITNYHVIEGCTSATITVKGGRSYEVTAVKGYDKNKDIAILSTTCSLSIPLDIREEGVVTGETVYAIGSPLGLTGSFSDGIVSSVDRYIDGNKYIQTTAPLSHGNSGGPLVDKNGCLVGITSASFSEGQNLNFAIPISEVKTIGTAWPRSLKEMFAPQVSWIAQRDFIYYEEEESFVLLFELSDENEVPMASEGLADIRIVNNDGVTVYEKALSFYESDFTTWTRGATNKYYLCSINISPDDIAPGTCTSGKVYFTIRGDDYYFDESVLTVGGLPTLPIDVQLSEQPITLNRFNSYSGALSTSVRIDSITYEMIDGELKVYFVGEKTYDYEGAQGYNLCALKWKLCDSEGYLVDTGATSFSNLTVGDKFKNEYIWIDGGITYGETYTLILLDN